MVAEQFGTLRALYRDRIDLGIGRAPGTDRPRRWRCAAAPEGLGVEDFPAAAPRPLRLLLRRPERRQPPARHHRRARARATRPQIWLLGSSGFSAQVAGALGLPFAFAHHFAGDNTEAALDLYRSPFEPSDILREPHSMIAVNVVADEDPERVRALSLPGQLSFLRMRQGAKPQPVSIEEALAYEFSPMEEEFIASAQRPPGDRHARRGEDPAGCAARLDRVDELMVSSRRGDGRGAHPLARDRGATFSRRDRPGAWGPSSPKAVCT